MFILYIKLNGRQILSPNRLFPIIISSSMFSGRLFRFISLPIFLIFGVWLILQTAAIIPSNAARQTGNRLPSLQKTNPDQQISNNFVRGDPVDPVLAGLQASVDKPVTNSSHPIPNAGSLDLLASFKTIDYTQIQQGTPPEPMLMVGQDHVVVSVNGGFQVFDKNGASLIAPTLFSDFWGGNCGTGSGTMILTMPFSSYDEQYGRYIMGVSGYDSAVNNGKNSYLCIAVSQTDSATGQWYLYNFDGNPGQGSDYRLDFPRFATGQQALYLGATMWDDISFVRNQLFAFEKEAMYAGDSASLVKLDVNNNYFNLVPVEIKGYISGGWPANPNEPHYFIEAEFGLGDELRIFAFNDPWGTPSISLISTIPVSSYGLPIDQPQAESDDRISSFDNRLIDTEYWNGRLWTTHTISCNPIGTLINCLRWYEIDLTNIPSPTLVQEGTFGSGSDFRSFPNLAVNACGDMLIGYTKTSSVLFPGAYVAGREFREAAGELKNETELHAGEIAYKDNGAQPYQWGKFSSMTIDPDGKTFWHLGEYSRNQPIPRWSTWVGAYQWSDCQLSPTPTSTPGPSPTPTNTSTPAPPTNTPPPMVCTTYPAADVPVLLPENTFAISSTIVISSEVTVIDMNVNVTMTHSWVGDLLFRLTHQETGTAVILMDRPGYPTSQYGCDGDDILAIFDDQSNDPIEYQCALTDPAINGTFSPHEPLSAFNGQTSDGSWILTVEDYFPPEDAGELADWAIEICTSPEQTPTPTTSPTATATETNTPLPTDTPTSTPTLKPTPTLTSTPTPTPSPTTTSAPGYQVSIPIIIK